MDNLDNAKKEVFRDGYLTALHQFEGFLLQTYSNKVLGIKTIDEFVNASEEDQNKVLDTMMPVGAILATINKIRENVANIMNDKKTENNKLDGMRLG